jgi:uncharacterized protein
MFFETSGIYTELWLPPLVAFIISSLTSSAGVSGAFLLLPFQMSYLGYVNPSVSATNHLYNIVAIPGGIYKYFKEGRMLFPLALIIIIGTLPGVFLGAYIRITAMPDPRVFKVFVGLVLLYIAIRLMIDIIRGFKTNDKASASEKKFRSQSVNSRSGKDGIKNVMVNKFSIRELNISFMDEVFSVNPISVLCLSLVVGIIGGAYGIGGGAIIGPILASFYRLPIYIITGAALAGTFAASLAGVAFYQLLSFGYPELSIAPDWMLGLLFGLGGFVGIYFGAVLQKYIPAWVLRSILGIIMAFMSIKYIFFG